jgi:hypothetical protein
MAGRGVDLKNAEEVKEYLENLGIEYRFGCYHEKNPKSKCQEKLYNKTYFGRYSNSNILILSLF